MKKRLLSLALCGVLLYDTLVGCGGNETPSTSQELFSSQTAEEPKILTAAVGMKLNTLYPLSMDVQNDAGTKLRYEDLVNYENGEIIPYLAESWEFSDGGKALTLHLKEGATFHDRMSSNAEAARTDFGLAHPNPNFSNISAVAEMESIEVMDEYTVVFHHPGPYFAYLTDFYYPETTVLVFPAILEEGNYQSMNGVVGTGPYVYKGIVDGDCARLVRSENHREEQPYYDEVIVKYIPGASTRLQALQSGEIDLIYGNALLTWDDYQQATSLPNIAGAVAGSGSKTHDLVPDVSGVLSDLRAREAVACAIDKETLSEKLTYDEETLTNHLLPDGILYTDMELSVVRTYDPEKANTFLDETGWVLNESAGIREEDGQALSSKYTCDSRDALNKSPVMAIKSQLAAIGIDAETEGQEMMTRQQESVAGSYDLIMQSTKQFYTGLHNYFIPMLSHSPYVPSLPAVEGSGELLSLIEEPQTADDNARVQKIFDELLNFDNDNALDLSLLFVKGIIVYNTNKIAGYDSSSMPMFFDTWLIQLVE